MAKLLQPYQVFTPSPQLWPTDPPLYVPAVTPHGDNQPWGNGGKRFSSGQGLNSGQDSNTAVSAINLYGPGVAVDPVPNTGVLGVFIPGMGALTELVGNPNSGNFSLTNAFQTVQVSAWSQLAIYLTPGRYLLMVTLAITGATAGDQIKAQLLNTGTNQVVPNSQISEQATSTGEFSLTKSFMVTVGANSLYVLQAENFTSSRASVVMADSGLDALQVAPVQSVSQYTLGITNFTPNYGLSGTTVVITGYGFANAIGVWFGGIPATSWVVNSDTQITAVTPVMRGNGSISVGMLTSVATAIGTYLYSSSAPSPGGVSANLYRWWEADTGITLSGSSVTGWADQSGNGGNATSSGVNCPTYTASALNGLPGLVFTVAPTYMSIATFSLTNFTAFGVYKYTAPGNYSYLMASCWITTNSSGNGMGNYDGTNYNACSSSVDPANTFNYRSMTNGAVYITGTSESLNHSPYGSSPATSFNATQIGHTSATYTFNGTICELIIYSAQLSTVNRQAVEAYLHTKWGV